MSLGDAEAAARKPASQITAGGWSATATPIADAMPDDIYNRVYVIREALSDYLEGPRSLREAERRISEVLPLLDGLLETLKDS